MRRLAASIDDTLGFEDLDRYLDGADVKADELEFIHSRLKQKRLYAKLSAKQQRIAQLFAKWLEIADDISVAQRERQRAWDRDGHDIEMRPTGAVLPDCSVTAEELAETVTELALPQQQLIPSKVARCSNPALLWPQVHRFDPTTVLQQQKSQEQK